MEKKNNAIVLFFKDTVHFADLINGALFDGEQIILPEELSLKNGETDIILKDKNNKNIAVNRYRDIIMEWRKQVTLVMLACEVQENVHYAMPVRNMLYDSLSYTNQINELWKSLSDEEKCNIDNGEFLSHIRKEDFIYPIITVVFYYGDDWDGNLDLHSMFNFNDNIWNEEISKKVLEKYVPNYHINLINPTKIEDLSVFKSDLQLIFGMLKYKDDKEKLFNFTKDNKSYFSSVNSTTINAIDAFLNFNVKLETILGKDEKEEKDMCKALDDLYNDGVVAGIKQGISQGTVTAFKSIGWSDDAIIDKLIELYNMTTDEAKKLISTTA